MPFLLASWGTLCFDKPRWVPHSPHFQAHPRGASSCRATQQGQRGCPTAARNAKAHLAPYDTHAVGRPNSTGGITQEHRESVSAFRKADCGASVQEGTRPFTAADHSHKFSSEGKLLKLWGGFPAQYKPREGNSG